MKWSQLPFDMQQAIVGRLPIGDLFQVGLVCRTLYETQQKLLPSVLSTVSSIRIDFDPSEETMSSVKADFYLNEPHRVMVKLSQDNLNRSIYDLVVTKSTFKALATLFPNIKRLTIVLYKWSANLDIILSDLLSFWPNLTKLTMIFSGRVIGPNLWQLSDSINKLKSLKELSMDLALYQLQLSIYGQLEHISCKLQKVNAGISKRHAHHWSQLLTERMTLYPNIKTIGLYVDDVSRYVNYSKWPSSVTNRISRLVHMHDPRPGQSMLDVICDKFTSLAYLHLPTFIDPTLASTLASALPLLSKLEHLQVLHLAIQVEPPPKETKLPLLKLVKQVTFLTPLDPHQRCSTGDTCHILPKCSSYWL